MDVPWPGVRIMDSDRTALKQITKEEKCSMSDLMVRAMKPYLSGEAELPYKSAGRQVANHTRHRSRDQGHDQRDVRQARPERERGPAVHDL